MGLAMTLHNWQCHRALELDLADGVHLVLAANMAGKTAIRDAIEFAFAGTGVLRGIKTKKDLALLSIHEDEKECSVEVLLKGPGGTPGVYALRSMTRTGAQELIVGSEAGRIQTEKLGDAQEQLWTLLGLDADRLRIILGADPFFTEGPNERRELVASLLSDVAIDEEELCDRLMRRDIAALDAAEFAGLVKKHGWRKAEETAGRRRADAKAMIGAMGDPEAPQKVFQPKWRKDPLDLSRVRLEDMEERLAELRETETQLREKQAEGRGAIEARLGLKEKELEAVREEIEDLEQSEAPLEPLRQAVEDLETERDGAKETYDAVKGALGKMTAEADAPDAEEFVRPDPCPVIPGGPTCPMTPKKMEAHMATVAARVSEIRREIEELEPEVEARQDKLEEIEGRLAEARAKFEHQIQIGDRLDQLRPRASALEGEIEQESKALADAKDERPADSDFVTERISQGEATIKAKRAYDTAVERFATYGETRKGHENDRDRWDRVAKALAPNEVEAVFVERYLEPVRSAIERFGKRFGGMRLDRDFNVELLWEDRWRRWHQLSESGRVRVGYAVQYAFASLTGFRLLLLDQIDHLDAEGKLATVETLRDHAGEFYCSLGLATLQRAEPSRTPFDDVSTWHLAGAEIRGVE